MDQYQNGSSGIEFQQPSKKTPAWLAVILWLVFAGIVGGTTYYSVNKKATTDKNDLQAQIDDLNKKYTTNQAALADARSASVIASSSATSVATTPTTQTTAADPTAGWKTYTNTTYKYSIKYPSTWKVKDFGMLDLDNPSLVGFNKTDTPTVENSIVSVGISNLNDFGYISKLENTLANFKKTDVTINTYEMSRITGSDEGGKAQVRYVTSLPKDSKNAAYFFLGDGSISSDLTDFTNMVNSVSFTK